MRIAWIVSAQHLETTSAGLYSSIASYRYRMIIPAKELKRRGHRVIAVGASPAAGGYEYAAQQLRDADVVVFGKMAEWDLQARLVDAARKAGIGVVVDVCDDYFTDDPAGASYRSVVESGEAVTVSSSVLAARVAETTGRHATVIVDPYEGAPGAPKWAPGARIEAAWFGHQSNLVGLDRSLDSLAASGIPMRLVVVTRAMPEVLDWHRRTRAEVAPAIELDFLEWSLEATARALADCNVVLLPVDRAQSFFLSKGANRVVESFRAGRFVLAHPLPAYEEFGRWAWLGEDIAAGLDWAVKNSSGIVGRIAQAQAYIAAKFSPQRVAEAWDAVLTEVQARRASRIG
jgi:glycosyltransferase involved in cell wall biosynthesis